jgi:hypothetical protein
VAAQFGASGKARAATLAVSWIGKSNSGGISSIARLLTTVPIPQQAAAAARSSRSRRATQMEPVTGMSIAASY